jgi:creatinine amidohydrolase
MTGPRRLVEMSWPEIGELVSAGESLCVLPVGATEQHGRHLPIGTDTYLVEAFCDAASERTGVPLLPALAVSSSHAHTTNWPGTFSLRPRQVIEVVTELACWVRASGFEKLLIVNAHGGNPAPLTVAVDEIRCAGGLEVGLAHWFRLTPAVQAAVEADGRDWHANAAETSLMLHLRPDLVDRDQIRDDPDRTEGLVFSYTVARTSVDGLTGAPTLATAEEGERLFEEVVDALTASFVAGRDERPPRLPQASHEGFDPVQERTSR